MNSLLGGIINNIGSSHSTFIPAGTNDFQTQAFDTTLDLAYQGNGFALPAVAKDVIPGYPSIHLPQFANDGNYGNGKSWISNSPNSWVKIDLGRTVSIGSITFGRERKPNYYDRQFSSISVDVALSDNIYANGNDTNDASEYTNVFSGLNPGFSGGDTLQILFSAPVTARFVKFNISSTGTDIDEFEVFAPTRAAVPEPTSFAVFGIGFLAVVAFATVRRRRLAIAR